MTLADELRALASRLDDTDAGLVATSAWAMDRLVMRLAKALGVPESVVRISDGLDARKGPPDATSVPEVSTDPRDTGNASQASPQTAPRRGNA